MILPTSSTHPNAERHTPPAGVALKTEIAGQAGLSEVVDTDAPEVQASVAVPKYFAAYEEALSTIGANRADRDRAEG